MTIVPKVAANPTSKEPSIAIRLVIISPIDEGATGVRPATAVGAYGSRPIATMRASFAVLLQLALSHRAGIFGFVVRLSVFNSQTIWLSEQAYWQVKLRLDLKVTALGKTQFKNQDPPSHCLIENIQTALSQQLFNVAIAECEADVEPNGVLDEAMPELVAANEIFMRHHIEAATIVVTKPCRIFDAVRA